MWNITEQPYTLLITAAAVLLILLIIRSFIMEKFKLYYFLLPIIITAAGFGIDYFFVTDKEHIGNVLKELSGAVENEQLQAIGRLISDDYSDSIHLNKEKILLRCRSDMNTQFIEKAIFQLQNLNITPPTAELKLSARVIFEPQSYVAQSYKSIFYAVLEMKLHKETEGWQIINIELKELDFQKTCWTDISPYTY